MLTPRHNQQQLVRLGLPKWLNRSNQISDIHDALYLLQHRGQDACGIATCGERGRIYQCKGNGMASKVFQDGDRVPDLPGFMGVGHLRYPTGQLSVSSQWNAA